MSISFLCCGKVYFTFDSEDLFLIVSFYRIAAILTCLELKGYLKCKLTVFHFVIEAQLYIFSYFTHLCFLILFNKHTLNVINLKKLEFLKLKVCLKQFRTNTYTYAYCLKMCNSRMHIFNLRNL